MKERKAKTEESRQTESITATTIIITTTTGEEKERSVWPEKENTTWSVTIYTYICTYISKIVEPFDWDNIYSN